MERSLGGLQSQTLWRGEKSCTAENRTRDVETSFTMNRFRDCHTFHPSASRIQSIIPPPTQFRYCLHCEFEFIWQLIKLLGKCIYISSCQITYPSAFHISTYSLNLAFTVQCLTQRPLLPLWSSDQCSWLQIQRSGFDSRPYQIFWEVVGLKRGPLSLMSTTWKKK
jgi:hypothetical protein